VLSRLSLRARLILAVIALAAVGLVTADLVTYSELRSFEIDRTDSALDAAHNAVEGPLLHGPPGGQQFNVGNAGPGFGLIRPGGPQRNAPIQTRIGSLTAVVRGYYVELRRPNGRVLTHGFAAQFQGAAPPPAPKLPASISLPSSPTGPDRVAYFTVHAVSGGDRYRVRASIEPDTTNLELIIAAPLSAVDSTLHRLLTIEIVATAAVLLGIGLLGLWVVQLGLRPLDAMGRTASAIAAGDLSRRVDRADDRTEVGRLGLALNKMLANIETAVTARDTSLRALEASESKLRRFVADASHELRTPLAAVRAYAELFTRGAASRPDDLERSMTGISRESERMSVLVEDLLLLAHLDEGRPLELEPVQLADVVAEAVETARTLEPGRPIEVSLGEAVVEGDRDRLRQVVDNLLSNVRSHTPADGLLRVTLEPNGSSAVLSVADSGPGLDPEQLANVFERFYRADPSRARASGGAGLGLAIVAAVVDAHGGTVAAESRPGEGTTFRVSLPLAGS
jgi:two-component system, OmpR family, sensor kinase